MPVTSRPDEVSASAYGGKNRLSLAGGAVHRESQLDQVFDHHLDLVFACRLLHCNNHS